MEFKAGEKYFTLDGKPFYLFSGEVQYFRIPQQHWLTHLQKLKAAGANVVSTYIPWSWHEIAEGEFDFTGQTDPQRDVITFMRLAQETGLWLSVKPGPYIVAEYADQGIPEWLTQNHPEIMAQGVQVVTYLHPAFQHYVKHWYNAVLPLIAERQVTRGGNIILMQVCNEAGLYQWLEGAGDTSRVSLDYFQRFLQKQYRRIEQLNRLYGKQYKSFAAVAAPSHPTRQVGDFIHWNDWHDFHRWYYAEYLHWLIQTIRQQGIDIQLFHNVPGWVFGRGQEFPVNITFYSEIAQRHPEMVYGVDHIPENPNYRNQHDDLIINEMIQALQGRACPLWAAEQQAGTREHCVHTFPNEMELFYKASLARGLTGMNLYMFSSGTNFYAHGTLGPTFYWQTALGLTGEEEALYPVAKKIGQLLESFGSYLLAAEKRASLGVIFYPPDYQDEFYYPLFGGQPKLDPAKAGLRYDPKSMRNFFYFEGMLRMLVMLNYDFEILDPRVTALDPKQHQQLWVMALDRMDRAIQKQLADYAQAGGHLFLWPGLPDKDLKMRPCTILHQRLGIREGAVAQQSGLAKINLLSVKDINALTPIRTFSAADAEVIAQTPKGQVCGIKRRVGQGTALVLGTFFSYKIQEHLQAFSSLLNLQPVFRAVEVSSADVLGHVRYGKDYAFLFLLNYTPLAQTFWVKVQQVPGLGEVRIPEQGQLTLTPLSGLMLPLNLPIMNTAVRLLWSTCELLKLQGEANGIQAQLPAGMEFTSQLVFQVPTELLSLEVKLDQKPYPFQREHDRLILVINTHPHSQLLQLSWASSK